MPPLAVVSAADSNFFPLLQELVRSIRDKPLGHMVAMYVLDAGLTTTEAQWLEQQRAAVIALPWPYDIEVPGPQRVLASRCRIPTLIPGYGAYLWIDADAWVQDWAVVELYLRTAEERKFCATAEVDRSFDLTTWCFESCKKLYGPGLARRLMGRPTLNAGVFAGSGDAPHWAAWTKRVEQMLVATAADFYLDQTALNIIAYHDGFDIAVLPSRCNWVCHRALPRTNEDGTLLVDPQPPHQPLGIIHMTLATKQRSPFVLRGVGNHLVARSLHYAATPSNAVDPANPIAAEIGLAAADSMTGHYHEALWRLQRLVAAHPNRPRAWAQLGVTASRVGDHGETVRAMRRAVLLNPDNAWFQAELGAAYLRQGRAEEAEGAFRRALQISPDDGNVQRQLEAALKERVMPPGDYVSPGLVGVNVDRHFPNIVVSERDNGALSHTNAGPRQNRYVDRRLQHLDFVNRDEAHILFNTALAFDGLAALEIGCLVGFSTCHLALGGVRLDIVDPSLHDRGIMESVTDSLNSAGVINACRLMAGSSPATVELLGRGEGARWSLAFVDGDYEGDAPRRAAEACEPFLLPDALVLFGNLLSPAVAAGLNYFRERGWNTQIFRTSRIMGVAWRGHTKPIRHSPDPTLSQELPAHLAAWTVAGASTQA